MASTKFEREYVWPIILKSFQDCNMALRAENWFWCDVCHCVAYDYACECRGTSCNAHGCDKCKPIWDLVTAALNNSMCPTEEEAKLNNLKKWGTKETPETELLNKIFKEN